MSNLDDLRRRAATLHSQGQFEKAAAGYAEILAEHPLDLQTLLLSAVLDGQRGLFDSCIATANRALSVDPTNMAARITLGRALREAGRIEEALHEFDRVIAENPGSAEALFAKGTTLLDQQRFGLAIETFDQLLALQPKHLGALINKGAAFRALGDLNQALANYQRAREINPSIAEHHVFEGQLLLALDRDQDAREAFDRAVQINMSLASAHLGRAAALMKRHNVVSALVSADRARQLQPNLAEAYCLIGCGQIELGNLNDAITFLDEAIRLRPDYPEALFARGDALHELGRHDEAVASFERVVALRPDLPLARGNLLHARMRAADWQGLEDLAAQVREQINAGFLAVNPFALQAICDDEATLRRCAELTSAKFHPPAARSLAKPRRRDGAKIRIGYVSGEFREQASAILMTGVWENHDKSAFEIFAIDTGFNDESPRRKRIETAFDRMVTVTDLSDQDAALRIAALQLDVLVNLNGFFGKARPGIFAQRPAPLQVNYLGFPGTLGADYFDYLIADETVIPRTSLEHYREKVIYLPGCYQANDCNREIATEPLERSAYGLPPDAFVFCCFNNVYKITPAMFAIWMQILAKVPNAVLWLLESSPSVQSRLRAAAGNAGITPERLIFADHASGAQHLVRHRLADLFLDTTPYNAHTTASDALFAGLPLLTVRGKTFPGRVAESLLRSLGLEALVASNIKGYEDEAVALANQPARLDALRRQLAKALPNAPLFDTAGFTRNLENLYRTMVAETEQG